MENVVELPSPAIGSVEWMRQQIVKLKAEESMLLAKANATSGAVQMLEVLLAEKLKEGTEPNEGSQRG